jgi:hypothetical protein
MNYAEEIKNDIKGAMDKAAKKLGEMKSNELRYKDIRYIKCQLMSALSDADSLLDELMTQDVEDKFGDYCDDDKDANKESRDYVIECIGYHKGYKFVVKLMRTGQRNGYIKVLRTNSYYNIDVHGGITYSDDHLEGVGDGPWIGFDCAHTVDKHDVESVTEKFDLDDAERESLERYNKLVPEHATVKSLEFCINECKKVIDQLTD